MQEGHPHRVGSVAPTRPPSRSLAASLATFALCGCIAGCAPSQADDAALARSVGVPEAVDVAVLRVRDASSPALGVPLGLEDALRCTLARNERLLIAGERYVGALAERQRRAASLLPTIDFAALLVARDRTELDERRTTFDAGPTAQYTLLTGMSDFAGVDAAELDAEASRWIALDLREALLLETAVAYYTATAADRLSEVLASSESVQQERLRDIQARREVGVARPLDVAQIEAQLSRTRATQLEARQIATEARVVLALLADEPVADRPLVDGWEPPVFPERTELLRQAATARADLRALEEGVRASRRLVDAAIGRYAPSISVNLEWFLTRQSVPSERDWTALLSIQIPIFSAGRIEAEVRAAWSDFRTALLTLSLARREVEASIDGALTRVRSTQAREAEFMRLVDLTRETLRQAEGSYAAGLGTNLERLVAQDALLSAELELARVSAERKIASLALLRAVGLLGEGTLDLPPLPPRDDRPLPESPFVRVAPLGDAENR
jgi:outer membrane protein